MQNRNGRISMQTDILTGVIPGHLGDGFNLLREKSGSFKEFASTTHW